MTEDSGLINALLKHIISMTCDNTVSKDTKASDRRYNVGRNLVY